MIVLQDAASPARCTDNDDCAGGTVCDGEICVATSADDIPIEATLVGVNGGVVYGPDGIVLEIDAGALPSATAFSFTLASATLEYENFTPTTRLYTITPTQVLATPSSARLRVPAAPAAGATTMFFQPLPAGPVWTPFDDGDGDGVFAIDRTGTFGVGVPEAG
ncbi:MAG: hypothetical protein FJ137_01550 [Deltaproteobacteria bacterium]|nr:hypothetical protein [Deltaproteobacteria bacterium]